ncbi:olfactory receptor Olr878 [Camelus ferus]|nr:olfactory receptor Olr878 [Camelus ferus]
MQTEFILLGLTDPRVFLSLELLFLEISFTNIFIPRVLISITTGNKSISFAGCFTQYFFAIFLGSVEFYPLAALYYDHYMAVCKPLHPAGSLLLAGWVNMVIIPPVTLMSQQDFCASNRLNHSFCDYEPLRELSCSDTSLTEKVVFPVASVTLVVTLVLVILSHTFIIRTVLKLPSGQQRTKAFSTCSSHLIVISLSYGSCFFIYIKPTAKEADSFNMGAALLITSAAPWLNPFIYTLRNQRVKQAFKDTVKKLMKL